LKKKGFKEERVTTSRFDAIGTSTTLESNKILGMITGFGFAPASTKDQPLAETFFALRRHPHPGLASVGAPACGPYVVDKGFEG
jgi:hypothetical protein